MALVFHHEFPDDGCAVFLREKRLLRAAENIPPSEWSDKLRDYPPEVSGRVFALMDEGAEEFGVETRDDCVFIPHRGAAKMGKLDADTLSLPLPVPFVLDIGNCGTIDQAEFQFNANWLNSGMLVSVQRTGAFLLAGSARYRIPEPLFSILEKVDEFNASTFPDDGARFAALAKVREAMGEDGESPVCLDQYLGGIRVAHAASFSLSLPQAAKEGEGLSFNPVLFKAGFRPDPDGETKEGQALLPPRYQRVFAEKRFTQFADVRDRYALGDGWYAYLDPDLVKALRVARRIRQSGDAKLQWEFCRNPRAFLIQEMPELGEEQADALFVETAEYSERVREIAPFSPPVLPWVQCEGEQWIPESFGVSIGNVRVELNEDTLSELIGKVEAAMKSGEMFVSHDNAQIPANDSTLNVLKSLVVETQPPPKPGEEPEGPPEEPHSPIVLMIEDNFLDATYKRGKVKRAVAPPDLPPDLRSALKAHQREGVNWMQSAWNGGQTGLLLADDMGLGKTLQALCFCAWLRQVARENSPILTVAPTGLLKNWREEYQAHFRGDALRDIRLIAGGELRALRTHSGPETTDGRAHLKMDALRGADWILASYETVRDYQHSFAAVKCAAVVFDEMQKIKSPGALATYAAKSLNAGFVLGMTGTPVENRLADLWCILDAIEPGGIVGDLREFSRKYEADNESLRYLKGLLTERRDNFEPIMLRRTKAENLPGLPEKTERKISTPMPDRQARAYESVVAQARQAGGGDALRALQNLRAVSLYPDAPENAGENPDWSARFRAMFEILDDVHRRGEKVLIFLESRKLQPPVAQLIKRRYNMAKQPMLINGAVTGGARQGRVRAFQEAPPGFDAIILSPRAAGVGITLTAANHVIHLSRWWNPAVEDQCSGRAHRIGQERSVWIYYPMAVHPEYGEGSFDRRLDALLERKRALSADLLMPPAATRSDHAALLNETLAAPPGARSEAPDWGEVDAMEPVQFEEFVIRQFHGRGWTVRRTPPSGDGGADVVVEKDGKIAFLVQCKHTQNPAHKIGNEAICDLRRALKNYPAAAAVPVAVTNAEGFFAAACDAATGINAKLIYRANWVAAWESLLR